MFVYILIIWIFVHVSMYGCVRFLVAYTIGRNFDLIFMKLVKMVDTTYGRLEL